MFYIPFRDTGIIVTTITQIKDSLLKYVKYSDSGKFVTITQLNDSLVKYELKSDSNVNGGYTSYYYSNGTFLPIY